MTTITTGFPHPALTIIPPASAPTALQVRNLKRELLANARTITSTRGGGALGHAALCLSAADFLALPAAAGIAWEDPVHPGPNPAYPAAPTAAQITEGNRLHKQRVEEFKLFKEAEAALRKCIVDAVPAHCIDNLEDELFGFADVTPRALLDHLTTTYAPVTQDDLILNEKDMHTPWDPSTPITTLWQQLRKAQVFAANHDAISDATLMRAALQNLENSGVFAIDLKDWRAKPAADQTWANLKTAFNLADKERLRTTTSKDAGFAGNVHEDKENKPTAGIFYCWTHGLSQNAKHDSKTCISKQPGHRTEATVFNMLGGNNRIHRKTNERPIYVPKRNNNRKPKEDTPTN